MHSFVFCGFCDFNRPEIQKGRHCDNCERTVMLFRKVTVLLVFGFLHRFLQSKAEMQALPTLFYDMVEPPTFSTASQDSTRGLGENNNNFLQSAPTPSTMADVYNNQAAQQAPAWARPTQQTAARPVAATSADHGLGYGMPSLPRPQTPLSQVAMSIGMEKERAAARGSRPKIGKGWRAAMGVTRDSQALPTMETNPIFGDKTRPLRPFGLDRWMGCGPMVCPMTPPIFGSGKRFAMPTLFTTR